MFLTSTLSVDWHDTLHMLLIVFSFLLCLFATCFDLPFCLRGVLIATVDEFASSRTLFRFLDRTEFGELDLKEWQHSPAWKNFPSNNVLVLNLVTSRSISFKWIGLNTKPRQRQGWKGIIFCEWFAHPPLQKNDDALDEGRCVGSIFVLKRQFVCAFVWDKRTVSEG